MKKVLGAILAIFTVILITIRVLYSSQSSEIQYNQAAFDMYMDVNELNIDEWLGIEKGTFDKEKHILVCKLPLETQGFRLAHSKFKTNFFHIDCDGVFDPENYTIYEPYELKGNRFELLMVMKFTNLVALNTPIGESKVLARKIFHYEYAKGKLNTLKLNQYGIIDLCK